MPCPDPHRASDKLILDREHHAMVALLCGVMKQRDGPHPAYEIANRWCNLHDRIDIHLANGVSKWDDRVMELQRGCAEILKEAYLELCGGD